MLKNENRFSALSRADPATSKKLQDALDQHVKEHHSQLVKHAMSEQDLRKALLGTNAMLQEVNAFLFLLDHSFLFDFFEFHSFLFVSHFSFCSMASLC